MTDTPNTSPEAVERLIAWLMDAHETGDTEKNPEVWRTLCALSAERDALKAALAEAVGVAARLADWIEHEAGCDLPFDARAIIARHQKGADT